MTSSPTYVLGLDVGGTNARAALLRVLGAACGGSAQAEMVQEARVRIREDTSPQRIVAAVVELSRRCVAAAGLEPGAIAGLGVGIAGQLSRDGRVVLNAPNLDWRDVALAQMLESALPGQRVALFNDLSAIAWGEYRCGGGRGHDDLLVVYVGTGVGSGLILGGRLYEGSAGKAGEIGHTKLPGITERCACGQVGCVEAVTGGKSLERLIARDVASGAAQDLVAFLGLAPGAAVTPAEVERAAAAGVAYGLALWQDTAALLGDVLSGALGLLNPSGLLLGGGVLENAPELRARVLARLSERTVAVSWPDVTVLSPQLGDDAGVLGAGLLLLEGARGGRV